MPFPPSQIPRGLLLACLSIGALTLGCGHADHAENDAGAEHAAVVVRTAPAERRAIEETIVGIGRSEALPKQSAMLTPAVAGQIATIRANVGDAVQRGDLIVELDVTIAAADLAEKEANCATLQAALDLLTAEPRAEDRKGLELAVALAEASVGRAAAALERLRPLRARKEVSEAQFYEAEQALLQTQLQQRSAEAQLNLLLVGPRPQAVAGAKARLAAAAEAVALSRGNLKLHSICAPIDGVLDSLACHPGQAIAAGATIGEVVDTRQLHVVVWLPAHSAARVHAGQTARLVSDDDSPDNHAPDSHASDSHATDNANEQRESSPDAETRSPNAGKVAAVGQVVDPQTGNVPVRVLIDNHEQRIAIGQTLTLTIVVDEPETQLAVPTAAIIDLGEGPLLIVVRDGKAMRLHPRITTRGPWTLVAGVDLHVGEPVVIEGGYNLPDGVEVEAAASARAPAIEAKR